MNPDPTADEPKIPSLLRRRTPYAASTSTFIFTPARSNCS
jgi:hypothetical protein